MKAHLLNRCKKCGHTWFPQGFDLSRKCPNCEGAEVDRTGRYYLAFLVVIALAAGIFWMTDRSSSHKTAAAASPTPLAEKRPRHLAQATPPDALAPVRIRTEADGKKEALRLYPDLGVANSPLNREFLVRYRSYQRLEPEFFQDPAWPVTLVKESAAIIGAQSPAQ
jgi:hypothetical protein